MDQEQLRKAVSEGTELEYLFDNDQWLPATISQFREIISHTSDATYVTITLLRVPPGH